MAALDGLRLIAALMVVLYHYIALGSGWQTPSEALFPTAFPFAAYGWLGVQLFFLISGFVICMSCWGRSLGEFFTSRVVRLYPAYWFAVLATTAVLVLVPGGYERRPWADVLINLTMLHEPLGVRPVDPVYWTLYAELRFYLLFALVAWRGLTYRRVLLFCCLWGVAALAFTKFGGEALGQFLLPGHCWYFIAGMAFYLMYRFRPTALLWGIVLVCFAASLPTARATWRASVRQLDKGMPFWPVLVVLALSFAVMALVATGRADWIRWRWLTVAGALTYPLYLLHQYIGWEILGYAETHADLSPYVLLGSLVGGLMLLAFLVHRLVEKPLSRWLKRKVRAGLEEAAAHSAPSGDNRLRVRPGHRNAEVRGLRKGGGRVEAEPGAHASVLTHAGRAGDDGHR
ncbi:acyltransferase [Streptomyces sp. TRM49041]|uniref:acyltransferase family protein n=1 Tax=Streptomyces sp. TRM49041 TaxID=2603216 RepID=UPI0021CCA165|nr:acyltransferase [Streptomyces sp. TRM49041]